MKNPVRATRQSGIGVGFGYSSAAIRDSLLVTMGNKKGLTTVYGLKADAGREL
jgi:hypothetical protein